MRCKGIVTEVGVLVAKFIIFIFLLEAVVIVSQVTRDAGVTGTAQTIIELLPLVMVLAPLIWAFMMGATE